MRTDGSTLNNANAGVGSASDATLKIKNYDNYLNDWDTSTEFTYASKDPGTWANTLKVCQIDNFADQTVGIATTAPGQAGAVIGYGITAPLTSVVVPGTGTTSEFTGYLKGIITGITTNATTFGSVDVKIVSRVETVGGGVTETKIDYAEGTTTNAFAADTSLVFVDEDGANNTSATSGLAVTTSDSVTDWYDQQTLGLTNATTYWKSIAPRPTSNVYTTNRLSLIHI